jgi:hypothetical protein
MEEMRHVDRIVVGKPEGRIPLGKPKRRWKCNIRMALSDLVASSEQKPVEDFCERRTKLRFPLSSGNFVIS